MRRNFAQILKDAKIDIKVEYQKVVSTFFRSLVCKLCHE